MGKIEVFGTVYLGSEALAVGESFYGWLLDIGNSVSGKKISWINWNGRYIAAQNVCRGVAWGNLVSNNFVSGKVITIDGRAFDRRLLKPETKIADSEWLRFVADVGEDDDLIHWEANSFWGQPSEFEGKPHLRLYCGDAAKSWRDYRAEGDTTHAGWRPVLEPLACMPMDLKHYDWKKVSLYDQEGQTITGTVMGFSDYDVILQSFDKIPAGCNWAAPGSGQIIVDRDAVSWIREVRDG